MIGKNQKKKFFQVVLKISKELKIEKFNMEFGKSTILEKKILQLFIKNSMQRYIQSFIKSYNKREEEKKNLLIVDCSVDLNSLKLEDDYKENIIIKKEKIYGGFIYLNKEKYLLINNSYLGGMDRIKNKYKHRKKEKINYEQ